MLKLFIVHNVIDWKQMNSLSTKQSTRSGKSLICVSNSLSRVCIPTDFPTAFQELFDLTKLLVGSLQT